MQAYLQFALTSLRTRALRSILTVIGIVIGVASIIALVSVGNGLEYAITAQFEKLGTNRIYVFPGGFGDPSTRSGLTIDDVHVLERISGIAYVTPYLNRNVEISDGKEEFVRNAFGFPTDDVAQRFGDLDLDIATGRLFFDGEKNSIVIGSKMAENFFSREVDVGNQLDLNNHRMKVVGILAPIGNPDDDNAVYVPLDTFREIVGDKEGVSIIEAVIKNGVDINDVVKQIERDLERERNDELFEVTTPDQILKTFGNILLVIQVVLVGIAAISLLVGAIGILNSMYTAVLERTKEIGILKALGAQNHVILSMFLLEAGILAAIGGVIGVLIGAGIALLVGFVAQAAGFSLIIIRISPVLLLSGVLFAVVVGVGSGFLPAKRAASFAPVDAIRRG
jgi:putative ABC transport system permease protein